MHSPLDRFFLPYVQGDGLDLGFGGRPITTSAITVDLIMPYQKGGNYPQHLHGDARKLHWFKDNVFDYVYSSHLLEDFDETENKEVLEEWLRVLKFGGFLCLLLPDQLRYVTKCEELGITPNGNHKISNFSLSYVLTILKQLKTTIIFTYESCFDEQLKNTVESVHFIIIAKKNN